MRGKKLAGRVALVTGSSRGIGLETARAMAARGAKIAINARGKERLESVREELAAEGHDVIAIPADVSSPGDCKMMTDQVTGRFGRLDILVNNAGVSMRSVMEELSDETCRKMVDINLLGCIYPTLYAIPEIKKTGGSIVFISSIAGIIGLPTATLYCATKRALAGLADSLRCELAPEGVHIGVAYVGFTENDPDKTVLGPGTESVPHNRPNHMSRKDVAKNIVKLIQKRKKRVVLTPVGRFVNFAAWLSPGLVENIIIFGRKHNLGNRLGIR